MKKLTFFISLCLLVGGAVSAQTLQSRVNEVVETVNKNEAEIKEVESKIDKLSDRFDNLEYAVEKQKDLIAQEQTAIDNSLSAANQALSTFSYILGAIGLIITVLGFGLGFYISRKHKKVKSLLYEVEEKKTAVESLNKKISETSREMRNLNNGIKKDMEGLYRRLKREETKDLLNRLVKIPFDILNLIHILISRTLLLEDFDTLLTAYISLKQEYGDEPAVEEVVSQFGNRQQIELSCKGKYLSLFYQNFCGESMLNDSIREDVIEFLPYALMYAFKSDIISSLTSLINVLNENNIQGRNEDILTKYIVALNASGHQTYTEPYQLIVDNCNDTINLQSVWNKLIGQNVIIGPFGNLLSTKYSSDTEFVKTVKTQIEESKQEKKEKGETAQKKDDE